MPLAVLYKRHKEKEGNMTQQLNSIWQVHISVNTDDTPTGEQYFLVEVYLKDVLRSLQNVKLGFQKTFQLDHSPTDQEIFLVSGEENRAIVRGVTENHRPINYFVAREVNNNIPIMLHWYYYTIMQTNRVVYLFALPFAQQNRLVWMDYDSVMVIESDPVKGMYLKKYDPRTLFLQPGEWIWSLWYNITIAHKGSRSFKGTQEDGTFVDHSPGYKEKEVAEM